MLSSRPLPLTSTRAYMRISIHSRTPLNPGQVPKVPGEPLIEDYPQNPLPPDAIQLAHGLSRYHIRASLTIL